MSTIYLSLDSLWLNGSMKKNHSPGSKSHKRKLPFFAKVIIIILIVLASPFVLFEAARYYYNYKDYLAEQEVLGEFSEYKILDKNLLGLKLKRQSVSHPDQQCWFMPSKCNYDSSVMNVFELSSRVDFDRLKSDLIKKIKDDSWDIEEIKDDEYELYITTSRDEYTRVWVSINKEIKKELILEVTTR